MASESIRVALGATTFLEHDLQLDVDDRHPICHGGLVFDISTTDGVITHCVPQIGFMHRSAEKLYESRDYRQIMMLANRHDWLSGFHGELLVALTVEEALGITPPARATWTRMLLAEVNRLTTSMMWCSFLTSTPLRALREPLLDFMQQVSGSRIHPMINRIGGLAHPIPTESLDHLPELLEPIAARLPDIRQDIARAPLRGIGIVREDVVEAFDCSGIIAQASGVDRDLRFGDPYLAYASCMECTPIITDTAGDASARYGALLAVMQSSLDIIARAIAVLRDLTDEPIDVPLPKVVRVPNSTTFMQVESPIGISGALLVSAGDKTPWRLKLTTPSFHTMQALPTIVQGIELDQLSTVLMSLPMIVGDIDR